VSPVAGLTVDMRARQAAQGGEFYSRNPDAVPALYLKQYLNATLEHDAWETEPGTRILAGTITEHVGTLLQWTPKAGLNRMIAIGRGGTIFKSSDEGKSWSIVGSEHMLAAGNLIVAIEGGEEQAGNPRKLFLFGGGPPVVIVGDGDGKEPGLTDPTQGLTAVEVAGESGSLPPAGYGYGITFCNSFGETKLSPQTLGVISNPLGGKMRVTIPVCPEAGCTKRRLYRTGGVPPSGFRIAEILDNTTTEYIDNILITESSTTPPPTSNSTKSVHVISRPPIDWKAETAPISAVMVEGRLVGFGNTGAAHQLYVSSGEDHEDFLSDSRIIAVYPGEGERLVAAFFWRKAAWFFKQPFGIYWLDSTSLDLDEWRPVRHTGAVGIAGPMAYAIIEGPKAGATFDDAFFVAPDGSWHALTKVDASQEGDAFTSSISELHYGEFIHDMVDLNHLWYTQMVYVADLQEVQQACRDKHLPESSLPLNNLRIKANLRRLADIGIRFHHSEFPACEALCTIRLSNGRRRPFAGGYGQVREIHVEGAVHADGAQFYASVFWTHDDSFQELGEGVKLSLKNEHFLTLEYNQVGQWDMPIQVYVDGEPRETLSFPMARTGFVLDVDRLDVTLLAEFPNLPIRFTRRMRGRGRRLAFRGLVATHGQHFRVVNLFIGWSLANITGGNKLRR
jgi:hypothetical protein